MLVRDEVAFKTLDGLTLKGWLLLAATRGPAIVMTPGFNGIKASLLQVALYFQSAGFTVLLFDPRSTGASDGCPRNELNPVKNIEDYHDAFTFLKTQPTVDPKRIAYWGYSFSGMIALCAAALDKRAAAVIAVSPMTVWDCTRRAEVLQSAMADREGRLLGNKEARLPMLTPENENPAGLASGYKQELTHEQLARTAELHSDFATETTTSSYYHITVFNPFDLMPHVSPTPAMVVAGERDNISPTERQKTLVYGAFSEPKRFLMVPSKGHMNILRGKGFQCVQNQVEFLLEKMNAQNKGGANAGTAQHTYSFSGILSTLQDRLNI